MGIEGNFEKKTEIDTRDWVDTKEGKVPPRTPASAGPLGAPESLRRTGKSEAQSRMNEAITGMEEAVDWALKNETRFKELSGTGAASTSPPTPYELEMMGRISEEGRAALLETMKAAEEDRKFLEETRARRKNR